MLNAEGFNTARLIEKNRSPMSFDAILHECFGHFPEDPQLFLLIDALVVWRPVHPIILDIHSIWGKI